jgi:tyrosyl-tRNA synthetase
VQVSGADQWGNITAGVDLIRRKEEKTAYALTIPLVVDKATGKKFGKSEGNAVWLDATMTSPYAFYQFWLNSSDESAESYLLLFTLLSIPEIAAIMTEHDTDRGQRIAQKRLALEVTALVHGRGAALAVAKTSELLFLSVNLSHDDYKLIALHAPLREVTVGNSLMYEIVTSGLASSNREAREFFEAGAISLNNVKVEDRNLVEGDFTEHVAILKRGKRNIAILRLK